MKLDFKIGLTEKDVQLWYLDRLIKPLAGLDFDVSDISALVDYSAEFDVRRWGVRGVDINVSEIDLTFDITVEKEFLTDAQIVDLFDLGFIEYSNDLTFFSYGISIKENIEISGNLFNKCVLSIVKSLNGAFLELITNGHQSQNGQGLMSHIFTRQQKMLGMQQF